ncbi:MAG: hypothetical protein AB1815_12720, partial [Bacillota bacterium]
PSINIESLISDSRCFTELLIKAVRFDEVCFLTFRFHCSVFKDHFGAGVSHQRNFIVTLF